MVVPTGGAEGTFCSSQLSALFGVGEEEVMEDGR